MFAVRRYVEADELILSALCEHDIHLGHAGKWR
jgi:hypothetical protein